MNKPMYQIGDKLGVWTVVGIEKRRVGSKKDLRSYLIWECQCGKRVQCTNCASKSRLNPLGCASCSQKVLAKRGADSACYINGISKESLGPVWRDMHYRCERPSCKAYPNYGGRGISVCPEWSDFLVFKEWAMQNGYSKGLHLDRIDNDGNYTPENCRFVTAKINENNRRNNRYITFNGKTQTASQWNEEMGFPKHLIHRRLRAGWSEEDAIITPVAPRRPRQTHSNESDGQSQ